MGGSSSKSRKITIENENPQNVITVSDDVVARLKGKQKQVSPENTDSSIRGGIFLNEPSLTSLQLRQQRLEDLKKNDEYWEKRIKTLEEQHKKMNDIMEEEYKKTLEEQEKKIPVKDSKIISKLLPPCHEMEQEVLACYQSNVKNPMNCSQVVQAFQDCVDNKRATIMASKC